MISREPIDPAGLIPPRMIRLRLIGGAFLWSLLAYAALSWFLIEGMAAKPVKGIPGAVPLSLTALSMILILLSSRIRSNTLRKGFSSLPGFSLDLARLLDAYSRATLISFVMIELAAALGLLVALFSGTAFYGIALCAASAVAMLTRWPSLDDFDRLARGRRSP